MGFIQATRKALPSLLVTAVSMLHPDLAQAIKHKPAPKKVDACKTNPGKIADADCFLKLDSPTARKDITPRERAFLDMIAYSEGTSGPFGYNMLYTKRRFKLFDFHPHKVVCSKGLCSSEAGRYQILWKTDQTIPVDGFDPKAQDTEALALIERHGALGDVRLGNVQGAILKCSGEWASFPTSPYHQHTNSMQRLVKYFYKREEGYEDAQKKHAAFVAKMTRPAQHAKPAANPAPVKHSRHVRHARQR
jgi:muramidase (phage lysozyme)